MQHKTRSIDVVLRYASALFYSGFAPLEPMRAGLGRSTGGRIRTLNLLIRSQVLYPVELRPQSGLDGSTRFAPGEALG